MALAFFTILLLSFAAYILHHSGYSTVSILKASKPPSPPIFKTIIPFHGWNKKIPKDNAWYDNRGVPLFYEAWRVNQIGPVPPEPTARSSILGNGGARVACWPSTGGIWITRALRPDLEFLGLDYSADTPRSWPYNPAAEDIFCSQMRLTGASFWDLPPQITDFTCKTLEECVEPRFKGELGFAWPERGGMHIVNFTEATKKYGAGLNGWYNAKDAKERSWAANRMRSASVACHVYPDSCKEMWCTQYPENCGEALRFED